MSSDSFKILTEKKGKQLSKMLRIDSQSISTKLISNMQSRINNPLFKLSIEDYEAMCGNNKMKNMMSKVIGCDVKQLTKFCKYINIFFENIKSSPKSIKNKIIESKKLMRGSLSVLPDDMLEQIVNKYKTIFKIKYVLKDWIPPEIMKRNWFLQYYADRMYISINPRAIDSLKANPKLIDWGLLCANTNPEAIELLKEKIEEEKKLSKKELENLDQSKKIDWKLLSENPNAIELLKENIKKINWNSLSKNPNAIELIKANLSKINWDLLSGNPNAIELLEAKPTKINWFMLSKNPNAIELLKENFNEIKWDKLSSNPNALELLKQYYDNIDWDYLSSNTDKEAIELLKRNIDKINWENLSINPSAIEILKANQSKIDWRELSQNPNAIELLRKNPNKIDWKWLTTNPSIYEEILD